MNTTEEEKNDHQRFLTFTNIVNIRFKDRRFLTFQLKMKGQKSLTKFKGQKSLTIMKVEKFPTKLKGQKSLTLDCQILAELKA